MSTKNNIHVLSRGVIIDQDHILLCKTLDLPISIYFLPGGHVEHGESVETSLLRELMEETGHKAKRLIYLGEKYANASMLSNRVHFFLAFDCKKVGPQHLDPNEEIEVKITSWKKVLTLLAKSDIMDLGGSYGILLAKEYLNNHKINI